MTVSRLAFLLCLMLPIGSMAATASTAMNADATTLLLQVLDDTSVFASAYKYAHKPSEAVSEAIKAQKVQGQPAARGQSPTQGHTAAQSRAVAQAARGQPLKIQAKDPKTVDSTAVKTPPPHSPRYLPFSDWVEQKLLSRLFEKLPIDKFPVEKFAATNLPANPPKNPQRHAAITALPALPQKIIPRQIKQQHIIPRQIIPPSPTVPTLAAAAITAHSAGLSPAASAKPIVALPQNHLQNHIFPLSIALPQNYPPDRIFLKISQPYAPESPEQVLSRELVLAQEVVLKIRPAGTVGLPVPDVSRLIARLKPASARPSLPPPLLARLKPTSVSPSLPSPPSSLSSSFSPAPVLFAALGEKLKMPGKISANALIPSPPTPLPQAGEGRY